MRSCVEAVAGIQQRDATPVRENKTHQFLGKSSGIPKTKLEIAMDALGPRFVTDAIAEIVGTPGVDFKWSTLVNRKDWIPAYRAKVEELYQLARHNYGAPRCEDGSDPETVPHFQEQEK
jgi:hypothetical protein